MHSALALALLHLHCRERWGKGGPIALATRHAINFLQQFIHLHIIHLSLHLHILARRHFARKDKMTQGHFAPRYFAPKHTKFRKGDILPQLQNSGGHFGPTFFCIFLWHILGISCAYLWIFWAYLGHMSGISWAYLRYILGISWAYLGHILGISRTYLGHISGISRAYLGHILGISWVYLGHILGIS